MPAAVVESPPVLRASPTATTIRSIISTSTNDYQLLSAIIIDYQRLSSIIIDYQHQPRVSMLRALVEIEDYKSDIQIVEKLPPRYLATYPDISLEIYWSKYDRVCLQEVQLTLQALQGEICQVEECRTKWEPWRAAGYFFKGDCFSFVISCWRLFYAPKRCSCRVRTADPICDGLGHLLQHDSVYEAHPHLWGVSREPLHICLWRAWSAAERQGEYNSAR